MVKNQKIKRVKKIRRIRRIKSIDKFFKRLTYFFLMLFIATILIMQFSQKVYKREIALLNKNVVYADLIFERLKEDEVIKDNAKLSFKIDSLQTVIRFLNARHQNDQSKIFNYEHMLRIKKDSSSFDINDMFSYIDSIILNDSSDFQLKEIKKMLN